MSDLLTKLRNFESFLTKNVEAQGIVGQAADTIESLKREKAETEAELFVLGNENAAARQIAKDQKKLIESLERENEAFKEIARSDQDTIESFQRENEELRAERKRDCVEFFRWFWNAPGTNAEQGYDTWVDERTPAAAITPEMREKIQSFLDDTAPPRKIDYVATALSARVIMHDLLGEQG